MTSAGSQKGIYILQTSRLHSFAQDSVSDWVCYHNRIVASPSGYTPRDMGLVAGPGLELL